MVSLTGEGGVSGFMYGKLQRATSIYGSGLIGPATAIVHGDKDTKELLPPSVAGQTTPQKQLNGLETVLWNQFGMATCEGSVEREDLLTPMSYLKPKLCELRDTLVFLDATTTGITGKQQAARGGGFVADGIGGFFSSFLSKKDPNNSTNDPQQQQQQQQQRPPKNRRQQQQQQRQPKPSDTDAKECWLDVDLIRSAVTKGSGVFVVCESRDTEACAKALARCLDDISNDGNENENGSSNNSIVTLVSPDDGVFLGDAGGDARWSSLRPQDLEGELTQAVTVRDGTADCFVEEEEEDVGGGGGHRAPSFKKTREERLAAAYNDDIMPPPPLSGGGGGDESKTKSGFDGGAVASAAAISRHDLAEVCVQCALRLPTITTTGAAATPGVRVVRVTPLSAGDETTGTKNNNNNNNNNPSSTAELRPNLDYFSLTGGPGAKAKAGFVTSVNWTRTLSCFADGDAGEQLQHPSSGGIKEFPKRPDVF